MGDENAFFAMSDEFCPEIGLSFEGFEGVPVGVKFRRRHREKLSQRIGTLRFARPIGTFDPQGLSVVLTREGFFHGGEKRDERLVRIRVFPLRPRRNGRIVEARKIVGIDLKIMVVDIRHISFPL